MSFPVTIPARHSVFNGVGEDPVTGNDVESWAAPVDVLVIAVQSGMAESFNGHTSRVVADVDMSVPPELKVTVRDRFYLPAPFGDPDDVADKPFEVVAIEDGLPFHGWRPGFVVKLNRVTG